MRKLFFIALLTHVVLVGLSQHTGFTTVSDPAAFKSSFAAASAKLKTLKSDFVQEKNLSMLSEKIVSKGQFWFRKENAVRMEYTSPYQYLMVINGSNVYIKDQQKENRFSSRSNKLFQSVNRIMMDCMKGSVFNNPDFSVRLFQSKGQWLAELSPQTKEMKGLFRQINVVLNKADYLVQSIEMVEPGGDNTMIRYSNQQTNVSLPDALFAA